MMQALESLTEAQVSDFLSGRAPLTLALRIGAHMMYVQLQLAAQNAVGEQQPQRLPRAWNSSKTQPGFINITQSGPVPPRSPTTTPSSSASPPCHTLSPTLHSPPPTQLSSQRLRTTTHSTRPSSPSSDRVPVICHHCPSPPPPTSCPPHSIHTSHPVPPAPSMLTGYPLPSSPLLPTAPLYSPRPTCSSSGPRSPAPASTFPEGNSHPSSPAKQQREPGAVIESLVNHSPGVFAGTFSGTLSPVSQNGINHPRRGIAIILQILNDLLSATRHHQGAPTALSQLHCPPPNLPTSLPLTPGDPDRDSSGALMAEKTDHLHFSKATGEEGYPQQSSTEENLALRRKLEQLQFLMHQRRLHRQTRRGMPSSQKSYPYQHRHGHSRSPRQQRVTCCQSDDSLPTSKGTSPDGLEMEAMEKSPWKPELTSDLVVV